MIEMLLRDGGPIEDIYIDPLIQPIGTSGDMAVVAIDTIKGIKEAYPDVHLCADLVTFRLVCRKEDF